MKALIRHEGETVTEDMNIAGIDWNTGAPLTSPGWCGGPYDLVDDYVPPAPPEDVTDETATAPAEDPEPEEQTVTYNGKEYTISELKQLLGV